MTRPLRILPAGDPALVLAALREALAGDGPAILPVTGTLPGAEYGPVPRSVAVVIETSGSTDAPKRVMLSTDALLAGAAASSVALGGPGQWLLCLPAHYIAGVQVLVRSIAAETKPVLMPAGHFDPERFIECAEQLAEPLRYTSLVPVQFARLLEHADSDPRTLAVLQRFTGILVGGQAIRPQLVERAGEQGVTLVRTYGSSETAGGCVYNGVPIGNTRVRATAGQLELSGSVLAEGYLGDPARTADRFITEHGVRWYRTGDLGEVDASVGLVRVLGRADNVIISGGEKVSLDAVERVVRSLPGLAEAVVVAGADRAWGQVPIVVAVGGSAPDRDAVRAAVASALGNAARPARIAMVERMPLLPSGKPDRQALRGL
ncbi:AMP-binding protein [Glaciibacter sp. 2TAF33]|uniref:AMP-binding protein n=1 Tax=Glaciibacter sp. 2TAF33 TaxID=3233015 RepID=UPI003F916F94